VRCRGRPRGAPTSCCEVALSLLAGWLAWRSLACGGYSSCTAAATTRTQHPSRGNHIAGLMLLVPLLALSGSAADVGSRCDNQALADGDAPGKFSPTRREFLLQDSTGSFAHWLFNLTSTPAGMEPSAATGSAAGIAGDWDGDGWSGVGLYESGYFHLRHDLTDGPPDHSFHFGPLGSGSDRGGDTSGGSSSGSSTSSRSGSGSGGGEDDALPIAGDWLGRGSDSVGLYIRSSATVMLLLDLSKGGSSSNSSTVLTFEFGPPGNAWLPIAGDWTGSGKSTVGLFDPVSSTFFLRTENAAGAADLTIQYGAPRKHAFPVAGRWKGTPFSTQSGIGLWDGVGAFMLRYNATGAENCPCLSHFD
jgi:hypothetical protein